MENPSVHKLTGFIDSMCSDLFSFGYFISGHIGAFKTYSKDLHAFYGDRMEELRLWDPSLSPIFPNSVFAAATFNFGPVVRTYRHKDFNNFSLGWCSITALGDYDPKTGGHVVFWEAKVLIEFPPGSTIFIPSALVSHSNTPISPGERRQSFTQYTAGGIFRFIACGFQTKASLPKDAVMKQWWDRGKTFFKRD